MRAVLAIGLLTAAISAASPVVAIGRFGWPIAFPDPLNDRHRLLAAYTRSELDPTPVPTPLPVGGAGELDR